jgi:hypothetical protein
VSYATLNGRGVYWGELRIPRIGAWDGDFGVAREGAENVSGAVEIRIGSRTWKGTARRSGENKGVLHVRVVGGAGGLASVLPAKAYQGVPVRIPLEDLLREAGETLAATSDAATLGVVLSKWNRREGHAGMALASLLEASGASWRVLADGSVWIGPETWPAASLVDYGYVEQAPGAGAIEIIATDPTVYPGEMFRDQRVSVVTHRLDGRRIRTRILTEETQKADRLKDALLGVVRSAFPSLDFLASYPARVVTQNSDGTLELVPDDARLASLSNVPIRYGVPGVTAKVPAGSRVLLGFAGGVPSLPIATVWESGEPTEIVIGPGASQPAAVATALRTELDAIWTAIQTHVHPGVTAGDAATQAPVVVKAAQTIASSVVKVSA